MSAADPTLIAEQAAPSWSPASVDAVENTTTYNPDLWLYRPRTVAILKRYMRMSVEVGRLPSLLGREIFRSQDFLVSGRHIRKCRDLCT